jgi:hypothetical protein
MMRRMIACDFGAASVPAIGVGIEEYMQADANYRKSPRNLPNDATILTPPNPQLDPETASDSVPTRPRSEFRSVRRFYLHIIAILLCAVLSLTDTRKLTLPDSVQQLLFQLAMPIALTCLIFPIAMGIAAVGLKQRSLAIRIGIVLGDILLSVFQLWVLLPTVQ